MPGRTIPSESTAVALGYGQPDMVRRRAILRETLHRFAQADPPDRYHELAATNLRRWRANAAAESGQHRVEIVAGDWGDVTRELTGRHGRCFAVLNMANAYVPGGGYVEGMIAQEENMFRRTDCHLRIGSEEYDKSADRYRPALTALLSADSGSVYLDTTHPRVCIRGAEDLQQDDLGYPWLSDEQVFPFFELRAAAQDLRGGQAFSSADARRRISAQLDTLRAHGIRHVVLSAFGCGAFQNPPDQVANLYRLEIERRRESLDVVAFANFYPGYGTDNYTPFKAEFAQRGSPADVGTPGNA